MKEVRRGNQVPTTKHCLPYDKTYGAECVELYETTGRTSQEWQTLLCSDMLAVNDNGLWVHTKFGYSLPRRNGKNEIVTMREIYGLSHGEKIMHTAHLATTSSGAAHRLAGMLNEMGMEEITRHKKGEDVTNKYMFSKQYGLEVIKFLETGGECRFRTRTSKGGLGEGYDTLIIDEAQEYTTEQQSSLKYIVSDSPNPQTIYCGTPPTAVSSGDVFEKFRNDTVEGLNKNAYWAEWGIPDENVDIHDIELWYLTNPSLGTILTERKIEDEITDDILDFIIQRLGCWIKYSQKSIITKADWEKSEIKERPKLKGRLFIGVKYGKDGTNVALSVACKTETDQVFISVFDCRNRREGNGWILQFLQNPNIERVVVDGAGGAQILEDEMKKAKLKKPDTLTALEFVTSCALFEKSLTDGTMCHLSQPSLDEVVTNCEHRAIGTAGGFGYKSTVATYDICIMEATVIAYAACAQAKEKKVQKVHIG